MRLLTDLIASLQSSKSRPGTAHSQHTLEVATAVLLIEVMRADGKLAAVEREAVTRALRARFALPEQELADLVELAHERAEHAHDLYSFTERLNEALDEPQRIRVFEMLWEVAYADGQADAHESHLLRRVADLLHIRPGDVIRAKSRAAGTPRS